MDLSNSPLAIGTDAQLGPRGVLAQHGGMAGAGSTPRSHLVEKAPTWEPLSLAEERAYLQTKVAHLEARVVQIEEYLVQHDWSHWRERTWRRFRLWLAQVLRTGRGRE